MVEVPVHLAPATPPVVSVSVVAAARRRRNHGLPETAPSTGSRRLHNLYRRSRAVSGTAASAAARRRRPRSRRTCCRRSSAGCRHLRGPCCRPGAWLFVVRGCPSVTVMLGAWGRCGGAGAAWNPVASTVRMPRVRPRGLLRARSPSPAFCAEGQRLGKESILEGGEGFERSRDASRARPWPCWGGDPWEKTRASVFTAAS